MGDAHPTGDIMANAFQIEERGDKILVLTLDLADKKVNTLGRAVLMELAGVIGQLEGRHDLKGLLFRSGKPGQFIAGADLHEIGALAFANKEQIQQAVGFGHKIFGAIGRLPFPTVALIDGNCMGGGTELVLAMDERIASTNPQTKIALPEVKIGVIPGWGGTQRLPRLIGLNAIEVICGGEPVPADKAAALGLVFDAVPADRLIDEGVKRIEDLQATGEWKSNREKRRKPVGLSDDQMRFAFATAEGYLLGKTKGQYPAPLAALKAIRDGINLPLEDGIKVELQAALDVMGSPISANLIGIFFMNNRLSRDTGVETDVKPRPIKRAGVIGAGLMGAGIATAHARSGIPTAMIDVDDERLGKGLKAAQDVIASRIKIGRAKPQDMADMLSHLSTSTDRAILGDRDIVIEAVVENEQAKTALFQQIKGVLKDDAILASNTSTISITRMAESAPHPERFIGMHFFSPVDRMELVEVIRGEKTSDETVASVVALAKSLRKTPIVVRDCAGFLVNRVLFSYMTEALVMLQEGASMDAIDAAATSFGMPMGPIALHDMVGIDVACFAGGVMAQAYPDRSLRIDLLADMLEAGRMGQKSGSGFRKFTGKKGKAESDPAFDAILAKHRTGEKTFTKEEITDRLFLPMFLESTRVLEEHIVREASDVDMGLILGIGFPPFKGGILRWCDTEGASKVLAKAESLAHLGKRFAPTETLLDHARNGKLFYPLPKIEAN